MQFVPNPGRKDGSGLGDFESPIEDAVRGRNVLVLAAQSPAGNQEFGKLVHSVHGIALRREHVVGAGKQPPISFVTAACQAALPLPSLGSRRYPSLASDVDKALRCSAAHSSLVISWKSNAG